MDETDIRFKLAAISRDALLTDAPLCSRTQMRNFLRSRVHSRDLVPMIESNFGKSAVSRDFSQPNYDHTGWLWLPLPKRLSQLRAPDCCALLAAMDLSFSFAQQAAIFTDEALERDDCGRPRNVPSLENARKSMLARIENGQCMSPSVDSLNYWVLRLLDPDWLKRHFPRSRFGPIPPMQADRDCVSRSAKDPEIDGESKTYHWRLIAQSVAGRRAAIRDAMWFENQRREYFGFNTDFRVQPRDQITLPKERSRPASVSRDSSALHAALRKTRDEDPPVRPTLATLARVAGITLPMATRSLAADPTLALKIRTARKQSRRRSREHGLVPPKSKKSAE
ncbi:hypothetical protein [Paraburkholderia bannensis]|uniref:hypothetical protein n=1 Tax=Paraburkholderia bannensis TaxID=765414 RepID=UPI002AB7178A|nr:hypothetical protein [Paraburkholderia bannensis]